MANIKKHLASPHYVGGAVGLIIILIIAGYLMSAQKVSSPVVGGTDTDAEMSDAAEDRSLLVEDQPAGESVAVKFMDLSEDGWIAIKEVSSGRILGAGRFPSGATSGSVELLRATIAGGEYEAMVYEDDGDKMFDHKKDMPISGMSASFSAQ